MKRKLIIIIISGLFMGFANTPMEFWYLAWFTLAPLWVVLILPIYEQEKLEFTLLRKRRKDAKNLLEKVYLIFNQNLLFSLLWGCSFYGFSLFWLTGIHPLTWMGIPWLSSLFITLFCFIFVTLWGTTFVIIWSWILVNLNKLKISKNSQQKSLLFESIKRIIIGVTIWCLLEVIESHTPLWWISLGLTQSPSNLIILQLGKLSGLTTITASIVAVNGLIAESFIHFYLKRKQLLDFKKYHYILSLSGISLILIFHSIGFYFYNIPSQNYDQKSIKIGLIQGNIPPQLKSFSTGILQAIEGYTTGYQILANQGAELILTPETALPFFWKDVMFYSTLYNEVLKQKTPLILGAFSQNEKGYTNSLFSIDKTGEIISQYDKIQLVPLGEYIPFQSILGKLIKRLSSFDIFLIQGDNQQIFKAFNTPVGKAIIGICYESAFPDNFRFQTLAGGEFIITASNNSFYRNSMLFQHHSQDVLRAIETDRWVARSTNTGLSAIINPQGKTVWISKINTYETHLDTIYKRQTKTLYVKFGDWLIWVLLLLGIMVLIV